MTAPLRSPRDQRVLAVGVGAVLIIVLSAQGVPRIIEYTSARERQANAAIARATRAEQAIHRAGRTHSTLRLVRAGLATYDSALVEGTTSSAASARLSSLISEAVDGTDARLGSVTLGVDSSASRGKLARVTARASLSGELFSIALVLQALEEGPHLLAVRELSLTQPQPVASPTQVEIMQAEIMVEGLFRRTDNARAR